MSGRTKRTEEWKAFWALLAAGALLLTLGARDARAGLAAPRGTAPLGDAWIFAQGQKSEAQVEAEQEQREREQEAREREQERKEREQEKKEQEREKLDQMQELYDEGHEAMDNEDYREAAQKFGELARLKGAQTDAALYWRAFAENKEGRSDRALGSIADLKKEFPQSRWKKDAEALEIEIRQGSGQAVNPEATADSDLKALALAGIMNHDPQRGIKLLAEYLNGPASPKEKSKYLFLLAQNGSPEAKEALGKIARGQSNPDLQRKAVEYLGLYGGKQSGETLASIYAASNDVGVKHAVLRAYMLSGDREHLLRAAKGEQNEELRHEAIRTLGLTGGRAELQQLYASETSLDLRKEILQALFLSGDSQKLGQVALEEKNPELRRAAVRNLGLMGARAPELKQIYERETDRGVKEEVLNAYFLGGNASGLIAVARTEKDPGLKKIAVEKLSLMGSKEANDYLMEILQQK